MRHATWPALILAAGCSGGGPPAVAPGPSPPSAPAPRAGNGAKPGDILVAVDHGTGDGPVLYLDRQLFRDVVEIEAAGTVQNIEDRMAASRAGKLVDLAVGCRFRLIEEVDGGGKVAVMEGKDGGKVGWMRGHDVYAARVEGKAAAQPR